MRKLAKYAALILALSSLCFAVAVSSRTYIATNQAVAKYTERLLATAGVAR